MIAAPRAVLLDTHAWTATFLTEGALSAAALNDAVGYTTPTTFTTSSPTGSGWYRQVGSLVEVHWVSTGTVAASTNVTPYVFPTGYRPAERTCIAAAAGGASIRPAHAIVDPDGTLQVYNAHSSSTVVEAHGLYMPA